tara:strand:+ start:9912 stop:10544 length:633 start_codon:yes stop_codon:yes gene_type:complete
MFGGTFDPVHIGHLRTCVELREYLKVQQMHIVPCARPPHREQPIVSAEHRLAMLRLAIDAETGLFADDRELRRPGLSYTVETLQGLRREIGQDVPLYLCVGMDSLVNLDSWHRWRDIVELAHLVVVARPGWHLPTSGSVADWVQDKLVSDATCLGAAPCGRILIRAMTLLPVSSSMLRASLSQRRSVRYLVPDKVLNYIHQHQLYRQGSP